MIIGTRGSALAKVQANMVADTLSNVLGDRPQIEIIHTLGDRVTDRPLRELEGRGYFTKEIEEALLAKRIDLAVHSFKDMPSKSPDGLMVAAISKREDPADLLIINRFAFDPSERGFHVQAGGVVGTSAVRRESQALALRPDIQSKDLRGNVPTRLEKLAAGQYDAIFLASAGIRRLNLDLSSFEVTRLDPTKFVPAPGQGALAIQMREGDPQIKTVRAALHDDETAIATSMERRVQARFGGGCGLPLGVHAELKGTVWNIHGFWGEVGARPIWSHASGTATFELADELYMNLKRNESCLLES